MASASTYFSSNGSKHVHVRMSANGQQWSAPVSLGVSAMDTSTFNNRAFFLGGAPRVSAVWPAIGLSNGGVQLTLVGSNFDIITGKLHCVFGNSPRVPAYLESASRAV